LKQLTVKVTLHSKSHLAMVRALLTSLPLLSVLGVLGDRYSDAEEFSGPLKGLFDDMQVTICDDEQIWIDVSTPTTVEGIRRIAWYDIENKVNEEIEQHEVLIKTNQPFIQTLQLKIALASKLVGATFINKTEVEDLVRQAVAHEEAFGSYEAAKTTKCGKPGETYQGNSWPHGFDKAKEAMQGIADGFFTAKKSTKRGFFEATCLDFMDFQRTGNDREDDLNSYCDELCAALAAEATQVAASREKAGKSKVRALKTQLEILQAQDVKSKQAKEQCENQWKRLAAFRDYLQTLTEDYSSRHRAMRAAENDLEDARRALLSTLGKLTSQSAVVDNVKQGLTDLGQASQSAKARLEAVSQQQKDVTEKLKQATDDTESLMNDLVKVRQADTISTEIKERLSQLLLKIDAHNDLAIREPLRKFGITENYDVFEPNVGFKRDVQATDSFKDLAAGVAELHKTCEEAMVNFEKLKSELDLSALCELPEEHATVKILGGVVQNRSDRVAANIQRVQKWLDPYKGNGRMCRTAQQELDNYAEAYGEPLGIRRMFGVYTKTKFYKSYLVHWKWNGQFIELLKKVKYKAQELDERISKGQALIGQIKEELTGADEALSQAITSFQAAEQDAQLEKTTALEELQKLQEEVAIRKGTLKDLEDNYNEAVRLWREASKRLRSEHAEGVAEAHADESLLEEHIRSVDVGMHKHDAF